MRLKTPGRSPAGYFLAITLVMTLSLLLAMIAVPWAAAAAPKRPPGPRVREHITEFDGAVKPFFKINFTGTWSKEYYPAAHGGQLYVSSGNDAAGSNDFSSVEVKFNARNVRLVTARYWQCGWCEIFLDGRSRGTFNLYADEPEFGAVLFEARYMRPGAHTLKVVNLGIPGSDDEIAQEYDLHFVNVDYMAVW